MTLPGRASVVRDRYGAQLVVGVPRSYADRVKALPGAEWDYGLLRWIVPAAQEDALRAALAGLETSWAEDHRTVRRCVVCREVLAQSLVDRGERVHLGCRLPDVQQDGDPQEVLPW